MPYVVRQGDYLTKLAHRFGFDEDEVWNDSRNADLRKIRQDPQVLCPCDILYIPEPADPNWVDLKTGTTNSFTSSEPTVSVSLVMMGDSGPLANTDCIVLDLDEPMVTTTKGDGSLVLELPVSTTKVTVVMPTLGVAREIWVGHLDPENEKSGMAGRLRNLGYMDASVEAADPDAALSAALRAFQADKGLNVTGEIDDSTIAKVSSAHGS
jgi:hypothetical protein